MKIIGIRSLKSQLSQTLRSVAAGEVFLVTDRGRVVAELRQPGSGAVAGTPAQQALVRLAASGHLRVAESSGRAYSQSPLRSPKGTARRLIDDDRGA
jgi:antitoxin (DNA-binding transcriptional repressor) of toxin-antitoxin stability system